MLGPQFVQHVTSVDPKLLKPWHEYISTHHKVNPLQHTIQQSVCMDNAPPFHHTNGVLTDTNTQNPSEIADNNFNSKFSLSDL